jgi:hypothetical protein
MNGYEKMKLNEEINRLSLDLVEWMEIALKGNQRIAIPILIHVAAAIVSEQSKGRGTEFLLEGVELVLRLFGSEIERMNEYELLKEGSASGPRQTP